ARARHSERVPALLRAVQPPGNPASVERFAALLWPDLPTAAEGVELCRRLDATVLGATKIPQRLLDRLIEDAEGSGLTADDETLAALLADGPIAESLGNAVDTVDCVRWGTYFNEDPAPSAQAAQAAVDTVHATAGAAVAVAGWALEALAIWTLSCPDPAYHARVLLRIVRESAESAAQKFLTVYGRRLAHDLASAKPTTVVLVLPAVVSLADQDRAGRRLLDSTCRDALAGRRKRDLDAVGRCFEDSKRRLAPLLPTTGSPPAKDWPSWWKDWRERNLPQSTLGRFFGRRTSGGDG
ncbi:MAG: hypothetical protein ACRDUV_19380, partial [Pseudonocardiaceae bacterium]